MLEYVYQIQMDKHVNNWFQGSIAANHTNYYKTHKHPTEKYKIISKQIIHILQLKVLKKRDL